MPTRTEKGPFRGFHAKIHAGLIAEFQVLADLPEHARYGVFAAPRTFPALVRFSNGDFHINRDRKHEPRGIAIKLIGVEGRKLLPGHEDDVTQDFLATSHSVTSAVSDVTQFIAFVKAQRRWLHRIVSQALPRIGLERGDTHLGSALPHRHSEQGAQHGDRTLLRHGADPMWAVCGEVHGASGGGHRSNDSPPFVV